MEGDIYRRIGGPYRTLVRPKLKIHSDWPHQNPAESPQKAPEAGDNPAASCLV